MSRQFTKPADLTRGLGLAATISIVVGGIIGSGIFASPAIVAREVGAPGLSLAVWIVAGVIAAAGALSIAELAAAIPETGGQYVFLRRAYRSPLLAFLFGWAMFFASFTGAIAAVATVFASYLGFFLEPVMSYGSWSQRTVAVGLILFLTGVNYVSVRLAGTVQTLATGLKLAALAAVVLVCFLLGQSQPTPFHPLLPAVTPATGLLAAFGTAMIPAFFAYNGWTYSAYVGGEVRDPSRNLPRSILVGIGIVLVTYLLINVALLIVLPFDQLTATNRPAAAAMETILGPAGAGALSVAVLISTFGTVNAILLSCTRTFFAMSKDRLFFPALDRVHPRFHTPGNAIVVQGVLASLLALSGSFEQILTYYAFVDFLFGVLAVGAVLMLRRREPLLHRPYRAWGYPVTPLLFVVFGVWYLGNTLVHRPLESAIGLVLTLSGVPFYWFWSRRNRSLDGGPPQFQEPTP